MVDFRSRAHHVLNGNNMRLGSGASIRADVAWRDKLAADDLAYFERRAGALNRSFGYR
jgi:hypothetical protein